MNDTTHLGYLSRGTRLWYGRHVQQSYRQGPQSSRQETPASVVNSTGVRWARQADEAWGKSLAED